MKLSEEAIQSYVETGGMDCPYCGSNDLECGRMDIYSHGASQPCSCNQCGKEWTDDYSLTGITEDDD